MGSTYPPAFAKVVETFAELYGADILPSLFSQVNDAGLEKVVEWQTRPLDAVYPILYLDCIIVKIRQDKRVINKAFYVALGVNVNVEPYYFCGHVYS